MYMLDGNLTSEEFWAWVEAEAKRLGIDIETE